MKGCGVDVLSRIGGGGNVGNFILSCISRSRFLRLQSITEVFPDSAGAFIKSLYRNRGMHISTVVRRNRRDWQL